MNVKGFKIILGKRLKEKWGRFLLASGGIAVGIWAITLTTSLSLGLSSTIIQAINSQPSAKEFSLYKNDKGKTSFFEFQEGEKFIPISVNEAQNIVSQNSTIHNLYPTAQMDLYFNLQDQNCFISKDIITDSPAVKPNEKCVNQGYAPIDWESFYSQNKTTLVGKTTNLSEGEIAVCYKCGDSVKLNEKLGVNSPEEMLGKTLKLEIYKAPDIYKTNEAVDYQSTQAIKSTGKSEIKEMKIASVVDDRDSNSFGGPLATFYIQPSLYYNKIESDFGIKAENAYFIDYSGSSKSIEDLEGLVNELSAQKYLVFAPLLSITSAVNTFFSVVTWVLAGFGFIALIASIFGIINIMTISVLERRKEIGILKSLGAKNSDIFWLFLIESSVLGVFGWAIGTFLAWSMGSGISAIGNAFINSDTTWKENLEALNITNLGPEFPFWLLLSTLALAIFFTSLAGVFPARRAAKQNPVDVLRSE